MRFYTIILALFMLSFSFAALPAFAKKKSEKNEYSILKSATAKYKKSEMTTMNVEKTVKSELMGTESKLVGKISVSSGQFRWENTEPEKSLLVFDGTTIWNEQSPPKEFPGPAQVAISKVDKKNKSQVLIGSLLGQGAILENFKVLKELQADKDVTYTIAPKIEDSKIKQMDIRIIKKTREVVEISYQDDVSNLTTMKFSKIEFNKKKLPQLFKYIPPKGAQVTNL